MMPFHFCPHCGTKLQAGFRFCPTCGVKLPSPLGESGPLSSTASSFDLSPSNSVDAATSGATTSPAPSTNYKTLETFSCTTSTIATTRPALRKTRNSLHLDKEGQVNVSDASLPTKRLGDDTVKDNSVGLIGTPPKQQHIVSFKLSPEVERSSVSPSSPVTKSPRGGRGKAKPQSPAGKQEEDGQRSGEKTGKKAEKCTLDDSPKALSSPLSSPIGSPSKGKSKAKKARHAAAVEPLQEGEEVTDTTGRKWKLVKLLSQSTTELLYEVLQTVSQPNSNDSNHIIKLGAKDGRIFTEQNFLQRAAKPSSVDKWIKQNRMDFLGIPSCVGFGLHADSYRFLIFPNMGQSLQSIMEEEGELLSEKTVLQLVCRILDVLEYIHLNEYVHGDINAENIYIKPGQISQVYLVAYCHAVRYCPGGKHVEYREASRTPHEGAVEFISLDAHRGAAPSRRSDLQSLGYCMLRWHTGALPWTALTVPQQVAQQKQRYIEDVPALLSHCFGKNKVSSTFQKYLTTVMALQYSEKPDFSVLREELCAGLKKLGGAPELPLCL